MATATTTKATAPATKGKGFPGLRCINCGGEGDCKLDVNDLDTVWCANCDQAVSIADDILPALRAWERLAAWVATAPAAE